MKYLDINAKTKLIANLVRENIAIDICEVELVNKYTYLRHEIQIVSILPISLTRKVRFAGFELCCRN